ncbi:hypothetical protein F4802DRAFT_174211 [Xylaria palmicola]|nr:hypothetical protein F4802DRAFT_174211 [Xylaria palmicola]
MMRMGRGKRRAEGYKPHSRPRTNPLPARRATPATYLDLHAQVRHYTRHYTRRLERPRRFFVASERVDRIALFQKTSHLQVPGQREAGAFLSFLLLFILFFSSLSFSPLSFLCSFLLFVDIGKLDWIPQLGLTRQLLIKLLRPWDGRSRVAYPRQPVSRQIGRDRCCSIKRRGYESRARPLDAHQLLH